MSSPIDSAVVDFVVALLVLPDDEARKAAIDRVAEAVCLDCGARLVGKPCNCRRDD